MPKFSTFNAFGSEANEISQSHVPVWLGTVAPHAVGGTLATGFLKQGLRIPAGTGVNLSAGVITPLLTYKVEDVIEDDSGGTTTVVGVTIDPKEYGFVPAVGEYLFLVSKSAFGSNGSPVAITAVSPNSDNAELLDVTVDISTAAKGDVVAFAPTSTAVPAPNGYLYNDIYLGGIEVTSAAISAKTVAATGAVVDFHGEGLLIELTPCADIATAMKAAVPSVIQVLV